MNHTQKVKPYIHFLETIQKKNTITLLDRKFSAIKHYLYTYCIIYTFSAAMNKSLLAVFIEKIVQKSYVFNFVMFFHNVRVGSWWYSSRSWTFWPITHPCYALFCLAMFYMKAEVWFSTPQAEERHPLILINTYLQVLNIRQWAMHFNLCLFVWVLWYINLCRLFNVKPILIQINSSISNDSF